MSAREPFSTDFTRFLHFGLSIFLTLVSSISQGAPSLAELGVSAADIQGIEELVNAKVPQGKFKGLPLNTNVRRPLYVLGAGAGESDVLTKRVAAETVTVANYFHDGEFYIARLPLGHVRETVLLEAPFSSVASHTMLRFVVDDAAKVELVAKIVNQPLVSEQAEIQIAIEPLEEPLLLKDMIMSIDGTEPRGQAGWNMLEAVKGRYAIAYRMVSAQERFHWFTMSGTRIKQTKLKLNAEESQRTLRLGIHESHVLGFTTRYHLLTANCTNLAIQLVKMANPYRGRSGSGPFASGLERIRASLDRMLRATEPITWFTHFNLRTLGWLDESIVDLQRDPEFRNDIEKEIAKFRDDIEMRNDLSGYEREQLLRSLGLDSNAPLLDDPARFKKAVKAYRRLLEDEADRQKDGISFSRRRCAVVLSGADT